MTAKRLTAVLLILLALTQVHWVGQAAPIPPAAKGLAQLNWAHNEDRALLGVGQWYAWGMNSCGTDYDHCTPMNRNWDVAAQTFCPPRLLLGNEPTNPEPAGHPIAASVAASVTVAIEAACPGMVIVAGNIHLNNQLNNGVVAARQWVIDYLAAYQQMAGHPFGEPHRLGIHCYAGWSYDCTSRIAELKAAIVYSGRYWLTEFGLWGSPVGSAGQLEHFLTWAPVMHPDIERYYLWTNRSDPSCCSGWPFELVDGNGNLTAMGQVYAAWTPPAVSGAWLPAVSRMPGGYP